MFFLYLYNNQVTKHAVKIGNLQSVLENKTCDNVIDDLANRMHVFKSDQEHEKMFTKSACKKYIELALKKMRVGCNLTGKKGIKGWDGLV